MMLSILASAHASLATEPLDWSKLAVENNNRQTFTDSDIPAAVRSFDGESIVIRGYMMVSSVYQTKGIGKFAIWAESKEKPINQNLWQQLPLHKIIIVEMDDGLVTDFVINAPLEISGTLSVDVVRSEGRVFSLYKIRAKKVLKSTKRDGYYCAAEPGC